MARAIKRSSARTPRETPSRNRNRESWLARRIFAWMDHVYRFLASVKLAVLVLGLLAGTLAYATVFERAYATSAVNESIDHGPYFAILLAFLGRNILCAALIRYPWKKHQRGFVITHAGLLAPRRPARGYWRRAAYHLDEPPHGASRLHLLPDALRARCRRAC